MFAWLHDGPNRINTPSLPKYSAEEARSAFVLSVSAMACSAASAIEIFRGAEGIAARHRFADCVTLTRKRCNFAAICLIGV